MDRWTKDAESAPLTLSGSADLLQSRSTKFDGDVGEEAVSLCAEVSDDVWVCVRFSEKLHLSLGYLKALRKDSLYGNVTSIKPAPKVEDIQKNISVCLCWKKSKHIEYRFISWNAKIT